MLLHMVQPEKNVQSRQRLTSLGDEQAKPLRVCATFAKARAWLLEPPGASRDMASLRMQRKAVDSLFIMASHGALIQYDLELKHNMNVPKDKICDDTAIELEVEPKAQWKLLRKENSTDSIQPPVPSESWLLKDRLADTSCDNELTDGDRDDRWLSQVEIITHAGPHRRLWMGPQFIFKTYNTLSGAPLSHIDSEAVEVGINSAGNRPARSNPMNMPLSGNGRSAVPVLIESGSCSSYEHSPRLSDQYRHNEHMGSDFSLGTGESQLREDLADAMRESPGGHSRKSGLPSTSSSAARTVIVSIAKVVNPLGTVTTLTQSVTSDSDLDYGYAGDGDEFIHENCDEALFRPVVAVFGGSIGKSDDECHDRPNDIGQELIVPVIEKKNVVDNRTKTVKETAVVDCKEDKNSGSIKKEKAKKELEDKAKEPERKERKKSDTKQPKLEVKTSGKKSEKTRKESGSKTEDCVETIVAKPEKGNKTKQEHEVEATNATETEVVVVKLPKKSQKKVMKMEEQKRETTPPKVDEIDVSAAPKIKSRKGNTKQTDPTVETISLKENEQIKTTAENREKSEPNNSEAAVSVTIQEEERIGKKQKKFDKGGLSQWPKVDSQTMLKATATEVAVAVDAKELNECVKPQDDDENDVMLTTDKRCKKQKKLEKVSRDTAKPIDEWTKISAAKEAKTQMDGIDTSPKLNSFEADPDSATDYMEILNEELRSMNTDCSNIQESLFKDPVVTTTFTVKKTAKKPSFTDVLNDSAAETSSSHKTVETLKPFDIDFEQLTFKDTTDEPISLINFESPSQDPDTGISTKCTLTPTTFAQTDKEKLIFALCGSLHCDEDDMDSDDLPPPPPLSAPPPLEGQDSDYKSLELDIDETYLSFELPAPLDTTKDVEANSSDDIEDSSSQCKANKEDDVKYKAGMDKELQPLIGLTISSEHFDVAKEDEALPVEEEMDESINQIDVSKQAQQMPEKQGFGNKKKSKKKRR